MSENNDAAKVTAGKPKVGGGVYTAPTGTSLPTTADGSLAQAFENAGYCSDDGLTHTGSPTTEQVKAWGGDPVLCSETGKSDVYKVKFIEAMNPVVLKAIYGDENVSGQIESGITIKANNKELPERAWVVDQIWKGGVLHRTVIPRGKITEIGDVVYKDNEPVGYEVTITALSDTSNNTHYEYLKQGPTGATGATGATA